MPTRKQSRGAVAAKCAAPAPGSDASLPICSLTHPISFPLVFSLSQECAKWPTAPCPATRDHRHLTRPCARGLSMEHSSHRLVHTFAYIWFPRPCIHQRLLPSDFLLPPSFAALSSLRAMSPRFSEAERQAIVSLPAFHSCLSFFSACVHIWVRGVETLALAPLMDAAGD